MSILRSLLSKILEPKSDAEPTSAALAQVSVHAPVVETRGASAWEELELQAKAAEKSGDDLRAITLYRAAVDEVVMHENGQRAKGLSRQMNRLHGIILPLAKALRRTGEKSEALRHFFLLLDLRVSADLESSRFLRARTRLSEAQYERETREAYRDMLIRAGSVERWITELINEELRLDATAARAEFDQMIEAFHVPLALESDPEKIWARMKKGGIVPGSKKVSG